jgi:hypothetical protein
MEIIGIVLGVIAIGLFIWLKNDQKISNDLHEAELHHTHQGMKALMEDFTNYQLSQARFEEKEKAKLEIRFDNVARSIKKNETRINVIEKTLPEKIGTFISQVEFAQNRIKR